MKVRLHAIALLLLTTVIGCAAHPSVVAPARPYLIHLPGIGGERRIDRRMTEGLIVGGYRGDLEIYDWTDSNPGLTALLNYKHNLEEAQTVADKIVAIQRRDPGRPIYLTSHSGGTGIAVWALERLPDDVKVDRVILLSSALSPTYDLSLALRHVRTNLYNFWSDQDVAVLNTGTSLFGTIDGVKVPSAGFSGFETPVGADPREYLKLQQFAYDPNWAKWGNTGGHVGPMSKDFSSHVLAPLVNDGAPALSTTRP